MVNDNTFILWCCNLVCVNWPSAFIVIRVKIIVIARIANKNNADHLVNVNNNI